MRKNRKRNLCHTGKICHLCGELFSEKDQATIDHLVPISKGGRPSATNNVKLAHRICNTLRGSEPADLFKMRLLLVRKYPILGLEQKQVKPYTRDGVVLYKTKFYYKEK